MMKGEYDRYTPTDPDTGLKRCVWCGRQLTEVFDAVRIDGRDGKVIELAPPGFKGSHGVRLFCSERCRKKRLLVEHRAENEPLDTFRTA